MQMIEVNHVSVKYKMTNDRISSLKELMIKKTKRELTTKIFWALKDVSFSIEKGDVVGIIGRNGAGKSTLLKIVSRIQKPAEGSVKLGGKVVPMLELGAGFDIELTGHENVYLNGAVLGYTKEFLDSKYEEIVKFAELGDFMETPIRNYSSGMQARLAFAIASMVDPDILIVDEVLSVGDENFQKKSRDRMVELMSGGSTVLFVSHSTDLVREICNKALWLDHGKLVMYGDVYPVTEAYQKSLAEQ